MVEVAGEPGPRWHHASLVATENGSESPAVGGAQKRGDVQWASGELRQLDEHQLAGGDLQVQGQGQILADARVLRPRQQHQVPAHPR